MIRWRPVLIGAAVQFVAMAAIAVSGDAYGSTLFPLGLLGGFVAGVSTPRAANGWVDGCLAGVAGATLFSASLLLVGVVDAVFHGQFVGSYVFGSYATLAFSVFVLHVTASMLTGLAGGFVGGKVNAFVRPPASPGV